MERGWEDAAGTGSGRRLRDSGKWYLTGIRFKDPCISGTKYAMPVIKWGGWLGAGVADTGGRAVSANQRATGMRGNCDGGGKWPGLGAGRVVARRVGLRDDPVRGDAWGALSMRRPRRRTVAGRGMSGAIAARRADTGRCRKASATGCRCGRPRRGGGEHRGGRQGGRCGLRQTPSPFSPSVRDSAFYRMNMAYYARSASRGQECRDAMPEVRRVYEYSARSMPVHGIGSSCKQRFRR